MRDNCWGVTQRNEAMAFRGRWRAMPGQRRSSRSTFGRLPEQELVAFEGRGAVEVEVTLVALPQHVLGNDAAQLHLLRVLTEKACQLLAAHPVHAAEEHSLNRGLRRSPVKTVGIVGHELALERKPRDVLPVNSR